MLGLHARHRLHQWLLLAGALFVLALMAFPLYAVVLTSLQPEEIIRSRQVAFIPRSLFFDHYVEIFAPDHIVPIPRAVTNSLSVALGAALLTVLLATPATYALTRLPLPGRRLVLTGMVSIYLLPTILFVLPIYIFAVQARLVDQQLTLIVLYVAFSTWSRDLWSVDRSVDLYRYP